jgi:cyclic beta-1,2-glucan synthetase
VAEAFLSQLEKLSPFARRVLGSRSEIDPPIRAELFGAQRFEEHGRSLAKAQNVWPAEKRKARRGAPFFPRVEENIMALREAYDYIALTSRSGQYVTPAADWLLDNFHLIESQLQQIQEGVPHRYYADLPKLADKPLEGLPRVYGMAWAYVAHTDSVLDPVLFTAFLHAYQEMSELTLGELWAFPTTLRVVLLENLRRMADRIARNKVAREVAHAVWDTPDQLTARQLDEILARMKTLSLERSYLTQLWQRMPAERADKAPPVVKWTEQHCADALAMIGESQTAQAEANLTVSNVITTLRMIGQVDWAELIEPVSHSLQVLRRLPSFSRESELTRQQITRAMERLSQRSGCSERSVAQAVVDAARQPDNSMAARTALYHLLGPGRAALEGALSGGAPTAKKPVAPRPAREWRLMLYGLSWLAGTALLLVGAFGSISSPGWRQWLALFLMAWPASEATAALIQRLIAEFTRIQPLARLDFTHGIPAEHRVLVVIPSLLSSHESLSGLVQRLRLHWLACRETHAQFALLTDWVDADTPSLPGDQPLLDDAAAQLRELNRAYAGPPGSPPRFLLLHRQRTWSDSEKKWIGWERKRGKLELLIRLLAAGGNSPFIDLGRDFRLAEGIRYVVTLDSDTGLPAGSLQELVSIAAHPLNAPQFDRQARRIVAGYGILQPRVVTPLTGYHERSPFHAMFAGQSGIDPYSSPSADLYQDLFGMGTFTGKGLMHVAAVHSALDARLPEDAILSHDLLEGSIARCGFVGDVVLIEDHPHHAGVAASRLHRWTRGDWQLLPLMLRARRFGIDALGLWRMADNLRRSTLAPTCGLLLVWVMFTAAVPLGTSLALTLAAFLTGPLLGALASLVPTRRGISLRHFFHVGLREVFRSIAASAWQFSQLAIQAGLLADAIARALWRMAVSRQHLLEWTTAAQAQASASYALAGFARKHAIASGLCVLLAALSLNGPHPLAGPLVFMLWAFGPLTSWWASKAVVKPVAGGLAGDEQQYFRDLAQQTWQFFERCVGPEDNHLPPDNLQMEPEPTVAHRTSPTNVGLYLLSVLCARTFGWITPGDLIARLEATLGTVERMAKHNGHLYNWYDTRTLAVLLPAYVSTVDSGNLAGHLLAAAEGCRELALQPQTTPGQAASLRSLGDRCERLCMAMDFSGLYNPKRHLFHIGLRVHDHALDASYYDLIASESRLTSFLAIAKGDVPRRHWQALGRSFLTVGVTPGLKSWSGSMFEYLMPSLVMCEPDKGLLHVSGLAAVKEQQAFGAAQQLPWGVSESAYFAQDHSLAYQYSPFGVPRLALRRTPATDRVVAPYATVMACLFEPREALANLRRLEAMGARGECGFFDAVDFTVSRQPLAQPLSVVKNFMAHHQGMSIVAICNLLCDEAPRRWFAKAPLAQAYEALLHEKTPRQIVESADPRILPEPDETGQPKVYHSRKVDPASSRWQPTHLLSNGRYSVALRANGAGVSRWRAGDRQFNISRWRDDALRDRYGSFIYIRPAGKQVAHSVTLHPAPHPEWIYDATFLADHVQFHASSRELEATTTVLVSPEDDIEMRTLRLHNLSNEEITLDVVSCFEAVLADPRADEAHPAFSNLFIHTEWHAGWRALLLSRKPRLHGDPAMAVAHFLADAEGNVRDIDFIADRAALIGRRRSAADPALNFSGRSPEGEPVNGLDPVAGLRVRVRIPAGDVARLSFATAAAESTAQLLPRIDKYLQPMHVERATRMAATLAQVRLRDLNVGPEENAALQDVNTVLLYSSPRPQNERTGMDQRQLWRFGLSGDKPIVLVRIHSSSGLGLVASLLRAQPLWNFGGIAVDLVVLNSEVNSYLMPLQNEILRLRDRTLQQVENSFPRGNASGFYLLRDHEVVASEKAALMTLARLILVADGRPLDQQVVALLESVETLTAPVTSAGSVAHVGPVATAKQAALLPVAVLASVPKGQFDLPSGEFRFEVDSFRMTPRPWVNVIANTAFGFQVSEAGSGYTWATNSRLYQLTPWSNDAVEDPSPEHYLLQDAESRRMLPITPATRLPSSLPHRVCHGQGYSAFDSTHGDLAITTTFFADRSEAVKVVRVQIQNRGNARRKLRAIGLAEWQMGAALHERRTVQTWKVESPGILMAQQRENRAGFGGGTAFLAMAGLAGRYDWTCNRAEFFDAAGRLVIPDAFGKQAVCGTDPCAAISGELTMEPGQHTEFSFLLGHAASADAALRLASDWQSRDIGRALDAVTGFWSGLAGRLSVSTPDPLFDALVNRWLLYQTLTSRLWSRAGFYQAGGAFGFRDQLQDAMAFAVIDPPRLRQQIVLNASRQFPEGDVQHWWHAPGGEGVRTHFSDDLLWLPYACAHYLEVTGDVALLDEEVAFIEGPAVPDGAEDAYYAPQISDQRASIYEHCARAIDKSLTVGVHGLPLMGTGDWNDGMNRVGHEGKGESVWLGWFLCSVVSGFAPVARARGETARAARWAAGREGWIAALHSHGWDGTWFRRAFFDNGAPLGSASEAECRIDLIAQAWAVLSGASTARHTVPAIESMNRELIDRPAGLLRLLHPPFQHSANNPGYIQAYPPGVRENGGQYSHAAVWAMMAQARMGDADGAWESFKCLSPAHRTQDPMQGARYELEPYVMAGDIYGAEPYLGRGGWSWYTGSAAWMHRAAIESLIGLTVRPGKISVAPCLPSHWPSIDLTLRLEHRVIHLRWQRASVATPESFSADVELEEGEWLELSTVAPTCRVLVRAATSKSREASMRPASGDEAIAIK